MEFFCKYNNLFSTLGTLSQSIVSFLKNSAPTVLVLYLTVLNARQLFIQQKAFWAAYWFAIVVSSYISTLSMGRLFT